MEAVTKKAGQYEDRDFLEALLAHMPCALMLKSNILTCLSYLHIKQPHYAGPNKSNKSLDKKYWYNRLHTTQEGKQTGKGGERGKQKKRKSRLRMRV